jgi:phosphate transport system protein
MRTRTGFERDIQALQEDVLLMGSMVEKQLDRAVSALKALDHDAARRIIDGDDEIDAKRFEIEEQAIHLIATQQPMATETFGRSSRRSTSSWTWSGWATTPRGSPRSC